MSALNEFIEMEKPYYYQLTDKYAPKILVSWHVLIPLVGLIFIRTPDIFILSVISILVSLVCYYGVKEVLEFQIRNKDRISRKLYDSAVFFFWFFFGCGSLIFFIGGLLVLFNLVFGTTENFELFSFSIFPFAASLGASHSWSFREFFEN